jgi:hypothetical protein
MITQCVCVLLDRAPTTEEIAARLSGYRGLGEARAAEGEDGWAIGGPSLTVDYRSDVNGKARIDILDRSWPDEMGSPDREPLIFAAWSMGHFGPTTYPGSLRRALLHNQAFPESDTLVPRHRAVVRVRTSYFFGVDRDAPVMPTHYDAVDELRFVSELQLRLMSLPGALVLFNPNAELLLPAERMKGALSREGTVPVDAWASARWVRPEDPAGWLLGDLVGMGQLDVVDQQIVLPIDHPSVPNVAPLLYTMAAYDAQNGGVLGPGDTASDAEGRGFSADWVGEASVGPPRRVLSWAPDDVAELPEAFEGPEEAEA